MNKERKLIEPNAIIIFDRDVNSSELENLPADFKGNIIIKGMLTLQKLYTIKCDNLYANTVVSPDDMETTIIGNLYTEGEINVFAIKVNGSVYCGGSFDSTDIVIAENLKVKGTVNANNTNICVGGDFSCERSIENVESLKVLGKLKVNRQLRDVENVCIG